MAYPPLSVDFPEAIPKKLPNSERRATKDFQRIPTARFTNLSNRYAIGKIYKLTESAPSQQSQR